MRHDLHALHLPMGFLPFLILFPFCVGGLLYTVQRIVRQLAIEA
jgi:hypothetical protein